MDDLGSAKRAVSLRTPLASTEEIIEEARNGRMFILVDDENRENEGDLAIPAQMATPDAINFMATHGRGLICLALTKTRAEQLNLRPMSAHNGSQHETAFTVSIEASSGVSTGISAADRARTIAVAIDASRGADQLVSPGHVFPLVARPGGVLVRAGHTEAAVDVARLAGLNAAGVICEIMKDDGAMARLDDLVEFSRRHGLKIGAIRDLIAYRRRHDRDIAKTAELALNSGFGGAWRLLSYRNGTDGSETLALLKGEIDARQPTLVRMHHLDVFGDMLGEAGERNGLLQTAMRAIDAEGRGVVVLIHRGGLGFGEIVAQRLTSGASHPTVDARDYGNGAQILAELGVHEMVLLTNNGYSPIALAGYGLSIIGQRPIAQTAEAALCEAS